MTRNNYEIFIQWATFVEEQLGKRLQDMTYEDFLKYVEIVRGEK